MTAPVSAPTAESQVLAAAEANGWDLLIGQSSTGRSIASVAGVGLEHPLRVVGDTMSAAVDQLAEAIHEHLAATVDTAPPGPSVAYMARYQGGDGRMVGVLCASLDEAQELAGRHGGHVVRRTVEAVDA